MWAKSDANLTVDSDHVPVKLKIKVLRKSYRRPAGKGQAKGKIKVDRSLLQDNEKREEFVSATVAAAGRKGWTSETGGETQREEVVIGHREILDEECDAMGNVLWHEVLARRQREEIDGDDDGQSTSDVVRQPKGATWAKEHSA